MTRVPFRRLLRGCLRRRGEGYQLLLSAALGLALALFLIRHFDLSVRPQLVALAETQVRNQLTLISDRAAADALQSRGLTYTDLVTLRSDGNGGVSTLTTDTVALNYLRSHVLDTIVEQVSSLDRSAMGIPLGMLTGMDLFAALGPRMSVEVLSVASATGTFRNELASAGINQTLHRVLLDVSISAKLLFPGGIETLQLTVPVCLAETVIIGQVPDTYLNLAP